MAWAMRPQRSAMSVERTVWVTSPRDTRKRPRSPTRRTRSMEARLTSPECLERALLRTRREELAGMNIRRTPAAISRAARSASSRGTPAARIADSRSTTMPVPMDAVPVSSTSTRAASPSRAAASRARPHIADSALAECTETMILHPSSTRRRYAARSSSAPASSTMASVPRTPIRSSASSSETFTRSSQLCCPTFT